MEEAFKKIQVGAHDEALRVIGTSEGLEASIARSQALVGLKRWEEAAAELQRASIFCLEQHKQVAIAKIPSESKNKPSDAPVIVDESALPRPKFDWYQSTTEVFISITAKKLSTEDVRLSFFQDKMGFDIVLAGKHRLHIKTFAQIDTEKSSFSLTEYKVELKVVKAVAGNWPQLEATKVEPVKQALPAPYASKKSTKDWSKIEKDALGDKEEEEGDALNGLLKKIYKDADEDTRRAMMKSYQTSGGTVLTTNWGEAAQKDFAKEIKPPKGQVYKSWEGDVIAKDEEEENE